MSQIIKNNGMEGPHNLVEDENKDTIMEIGVVKSQTIFPQVNWDVCCMSYHDKTKDEKYLTAIFDRMGWNYR